MRRVTGIGGIFMSAKDPKALCDWYKKHLGIDVQPWGGAAFDWTDSEGNPIKGTTAWSMKALPRAFAWQEAIETGRYTSVTALAQNLGINRSYVRRILGLAMLAPDIVEAIMEGREPGGMSLDLLMKALPISWSRQRDLLGLSAR
jgi:hypothetical protein